MRRRALEPLHDRADVRVHGGDVGGRGGAPGADRPDRLVGDHRVGRRKPVGQRAAQLPADDGLGPAGLALGQRLADADDRDQAGTMRRGRFRRDRRIALPMVGAPLGMADDDVGRAHVRQHLGRHVAGMRARDGDGAVLPADRDAGAERELRGPVDQGRGRADEDVDAPAQRRVETGRDRTELAERGLRAVHLPVSGDQGATHAVFSAHARPLAGKIGRGEIDRRCRRFASAVARSIQGVGASIQAPARSLWA